jgi:hypothetical protein
MKCREWKTAGVLVYAVFITMLIPLFHLDIELVSAAIRMRKSKKLRQRYAFSTPSLENCITSETIRRVWILWYQGIESAPPVVKCCIESVRQHIKDREIVLLDKDNISEYVSFPTHITERLKKGQMSITHFSDLLRLELLIKYGGTWIDATYYLTGCPENYMLDSELFMFQNVRQRSYEATRISSTYITATAGNPLLIFTRLLLYKYWEKHSVIADYFLFHIFFEFAIEAYPNEWNRVKPRHSGFPLMLQNVWLNSYDRSVFLNICEQTVIHKLNHKTNMENRMENSYYDYILERGK